jgi:hypothetical protein
MRCPDPPDEMKTSQNKDMSLYLTDEVAYLTDEKEYFQTGNFEIKHFEWACLPSSGVMGVSPEVPLA